MYIFLVVMIMSRKCKNPLMTVTATIMYYMELQGLTNKEVYEKLLMSEATWIDRKKCPDKFTLGDLSRIARILGVDMSVIINGLVPKEIERSS